MKNRRQESASSRVLQTNPSSTRFSQTNRVASRRSHSQRFRDSTDFLRYAEERGTQNVVLKTSRDAATISVVMPVGDVPISFLKEAVESVLNQTFRDFEFIIVDDGATKECRKYLESLIDERVRIIRNPENLGVTKSLNIGFRAAQGKYIARMDADDVCMPDRFQKQFDFMENHPSAIACGTVAELIGDGRGLSGFGGNISDMESYRIRTVFQNPGPYHSTAFFNLELLLRYNLSYDESLPCSQDYGIYTEIARHGDIFILPEPSLYYRVHSRQTSATRRKTQMRCSQAIQKKLLGEFFGEDVSDEELELHCRCSSIYYDNANINEDVLKWYYRLIKANNRARIYDRKKFNREVYGILERLVHSSISPSMTLLQKTALFFRCLPFSMALKETIAIGARKLARERLPKWIVAPAPIESSTTVSVPTLGTEV